MTEIAQAEGLNPGRVSIIARLVHLAPDVVESCLIGNSGIALEHLIRNGSLPLDWQQQRRMIQAKSCWLAPTPHAASWRFFYANCILGRITSSRRKTQPDARKPAFLQGLGRFSVKSRTENRERKRSRTAQKWAPSEGCR